MFEGVLTALVTPFTGEELRVDWDRFLQHIRFQLDKGIDGLVVLGTTGEALTLTQEEREKAIALAVQEVKKRVPLIVGTGESATSVTCAQTMWAKKLGADAALIVSPFYNKPSQEGLYRHFSAVAEAVDLPIFLYNNPSRAGVAMELETIVRLSKVRGIVGIKESSGSLDLMREVIATGFPVLCGEDALTKRAVSMGAKGVISVLSNLLPEEMRALVRGVGDESSLAPYFEALGLESNPVPIKALMQMSAVRLPLCPLSEKKREKIETLVKIPSNGLVSSCEVKP